MDMYPRALVGRWKVETGEHLEAHRPASALFTSTSANDKVGVGTDPRGCPSVSTDCYSMRASAHPHTHGHAHMYIAQTHTHTHHTQ